MITRKGTVLKKFEKKKVTKNCNKQGFYLDTQTPTSHLDTNMAEHKDIPKEQPEWFKVQVGDRLSKFEQQFSDMMSKIDDMKNSVEFACNTSKDAQERAVKVENTVIELQRENDNLKSELGYLKNRVIQLESHGKRENLLFNGIKENNSKETWEDCEQAVKNIITETMGLNGQNMNFERTHRYGQKKAGKTRPIIVKFSSFKDREKVWASKKKLSGSNYNVSEDFPIEIRNERKLLFPIVKVLKTHSSVTEVFIKVNKLFVNGKMYTVSTLDQLPKEIELKNLFTKSENGVSLFASKYSPLSNLYSEATFSIDNQMYCSTEQYIQLRKAEIFNDEVSAGKIKAEKNPYTIMGIGKQVKGYKHDVWMGQVKDILRKANMAKYQQVEIARKTLLATEDNMIGEATLDKKYGIGLHLTDKTALNPGNWAENLFGNVLMEVRNELKK